MTKLEAALVYASWGWLVLPVVSNGKQPATAHGIKDATCDEAKIKRWWETNPDLNVGIACGKESALTVFDIDPRNGGEDDWQRWLEAHGELPEGIVQLTAGGGFHMLCHYRPEIRSCKLVEGVDLLSDGRYFVACPSTIEGRSYEWEASSDPFEGVAPSTIPEEWISKIGGQRKVSDSSNLIQGNRNSGLSALAGAMRHHGMTEAEILAAIGVANEQRCEIPLPASEIRQIAKSVSRYEPESDTAAACALGTMAAEALLDGLTDEQEYHFTRGTSLINQPSPIPWLVKGWIPAYSTSMIFGESGAGKTFVALDIACCIATGRSWCGLNVKQGLAAYLAGEGNYGIRQRLASWCRDKGETELDNLLVSNKAIAMDTRDAAKEILSALNQMEGPPPEVIFVDTINAHMAGDENTAKDTRAMLNSCGVVSAATGASVVLIHHVGHGEGAKGRARGSSAWKGALDSSIYVSEKGGVIKIDCAKMKDAPESEPLWGRLKPVDLGWVDDDGQIINGVTFEQVQPQEMEEKKPKPDSKLERARKLWENAWWASGSELVEERPYLSRSALVAYLTDVAGMAKSTVNVALRPSGSILGPLLNAQYLANYQQHGWVVVDSDVVSVLVLARGSMKNV